MRVNLHLHWLKARVVAQLVLTPEVRGSYPVISKQIIGHLLLEQTKIKKKKPGMAHFKLIGLNNIYQHLHRNLCGTQIDCKVGLTVRQNHLKYHLFIGRKHPHFCPLLNHISFDYKTSKKWLNILSVNATLHSINLVLTETYRNLLF